MLLDALRLPLHLAGPRVWGRSSLRILDRIDRNTLALDPWRQRGSAASAKELRVALVRQLAAGAAESLPAGTRIRLGSRAEAWPAAESLRGLTRSALEVWARYSLSHSVGLRFKVETSSSGIRRDAHLLGTIDRNHLVTVRLKPAAPAEEGLLEQVETVAELAAEGLEVEVELDASACAPYNDPFAVVARLRAAGANRCLVAAAGGIGGGNLLALRAAILAGA